MLWNLKIKKIKSFLPDEVNANYDLIDLSEKNIDIIKKFKNDIKAIEANNSEAILCFRGDSKDDLENHINFFRYDLAGVFMVGSKAKSNYINHENDAFEFYKGKSKNELLLDLEKLIKICNEEINAKPNSHPVGGILGNEFLDFLNTEDKTKLEHWQLFFISFLHNNGKGRSFKRFKDYSPFISLTYGRKKGGISRRFATHKIKSGFVFIVSVRKNSRNYIKTADMNLTLKEHGINWYEDVNNELMLMNGIFPHDILGIMEVKKKSTPQLIINPWLFNEYINNRTYDIDKGIPVIQKYFDKWIEETNYKRISIRDNSGNQFLKERNQSTWVPLNEFER